MLYSIIDRFGEQANKYILYAIISHFIGLFTCGFIVKSQSMAKQTYIGAMAVCFVFSISFFFSPSILWLIGLVFAGYTSGCAVASWGYYLKIFTPKSDRLKSCADVLIFSNIIMIFINIVTGSGFVFVGLAISMACLVIGAVLIWHLPIEEDFEPVQNENHRLPSNLKKPMFILFLFVAIITVNSGLMYQVINPAFGHLTGLVSWYWAVPYIVALALMRNLPLTAKRPQFLYAGMGMLMMAFIAFMLLWRNAVDYIIVDTLMLGACGIFDLFWWSIIADMLDYTQRPAKVFGIGLSANVFGVLVGGTLGMLMVSANLPKAQITVLALAAVCITLAILPMLNHHLCMLLKNHAYLTAFDHMDEKQQTTIIGQAKALDPLTEREQEVLQLILTGISNKQIAAVLFVTERTVKTHAHNIYSKYDVRSRVELLSILLRNQTNT